MFRLMAVSTLVFLAACDSGGPAPAPTPTPSPTATPSPSPVVFTSPTTASVAENAMLNYQATASVGPGLPVGFYISGGADSGAFTITPAGLLNFVTTPDFEQPADVDRNNSYVVQLTAGDGTRTVTMTLTVQVTNVVEPFNVARIGTGFFRPMAVVPFYSDYVLVGERSGDIYHLNTRTGAKGRIVSLKPLYNITDTGNGGLLSMTMRPGSGSELVVLATTNDGLEFFSLNISLNNFGPLYGGATFPLNGPLTNIGGWIGYGPDGYLYILTGDGGGPGGASDLAQDRQSYLGKVLRIQYGSRLSPWTVNPAPGNPWHTDKSYRSYVYAVGLRNPYRGTFDGDRLIFGDVGEDALEEINVMPVNQPAMNFGWPFMQGNRPFRGTAPGGLTGPVTQYAHGGGEREGRMVIGGPVHRGAITALQGRYVFGDFASKQIWSVPATSLTPGTLLPSSSYEMRTTDLRPSVGSIDQIIQFGQDVQGNMLIVDYDGDIYRVTGG